jgi:hypothetical protein
VLAVLLACGWTAEAGQFGRNKVRYDRFDFEVLRTPHFDIYYYPAEQAAVELAARMAERWYARLSRALDHQLSERQPIVFYASHSHFTQNTILPGFIGEGVGGVTEHLQGRVVMPFALGLGDTDHVLGHELVHAFQRDVLRLKRRSIGLLPLWFLEGMAEYLTVGRIDANTAMWIRDAAANSQLPSLRQLEDPRFFPYRYGQAIWVYLTERFGEDVAARALASTASGGALGRIAAVTRTGIDQLSADWHAAITAMMATEPDDAGPATPGVITTSQAVVGSGGGGGRINVAPALSPDGREIVFLSERDRYSIDVYLAEADSGRIVRRLVQMAADPHFESLQFVTSAGAWAPSGRRFALAGRREGQPVISILDVDTTEVVQEVAVDGLDEAYTPSWHPDGTRLVFSGMRGGLSDLYELELDSGTVRRLTSDGFVDLHPAWSPDGRTIAFATDRFSSSLDTLSFGPTRLAALDVATSTIRRLPSLDGDRNVNPQWSIDGRSVFFVADVAQRSHVFRLDVDAGTVRQLTSLPSDVSGLTATSPALSSASAAPRLALSTYRRGGYELHVIEPTPGTVLDAVEKRAAAGGGALLPPAFGLPDDTAAFEVKPYNGKLTLNRISQPYFSMGGGSFGTFLRGGISFGFSDLLDQRSLQAAVQAGKTLPDFGARLAYLNRQSRWNWGVAVEQVGAVLGSSRRATQSAASALEYREVRLTQIHRQVSGVAAYPFSFARRLELNAGLHAATFERRDTSSLYAPTGALLDESTATRAAARPLMLVETGAALVHDSAAHGPTSPILGTRFRFGIAPTFGNLQFVTSVADYRRYLMPVRPVTVAWRARHVARLGSDAGDDRLQPLVYNLRDVARGYQRSHLGERICGAGFTADCTVAALLGTHQLFSNQLEIRVPVIGALRGTPDYGPLPLEGFLFSDTAWLWTSASPAERSHRLLLPSAGAGVRVRAAAFVFEIAAARRLHEPDRGWTVAIDLRRGF